MGRIRNAERTARDPACHDALQHLLLPDAGVYRHTIPRRADANGHVMDLCYPSQLITQQIAELADWRGKMLARLRKLILEAAPDITEEWKWDTAVWSHKRSFTA